MNNHQTIKLLIEYEAESIQPSDWDWDSLLKEQGAKSGHLLESDIPDNRPAIIARIYRGIDGEPQISRLSIHELLEENVDMEGYVRRIVSQIIAKGVSDDSDYQNQVLCLYVPLVSTDLIKQSYKRECTQWIKRYPESKKSLVP